MCYDRNRSAKKDECWSHSLPLILRDWEGATTDKSEDLPSHYGSITCWNIGSDHTNLLLIFFVAAECAMGYYIRCHHPTNSVAITIDFTFLHFWNLLPYCVQEVLVG